MSHGRTLAYVLALVVLGLVPFIASSQIVNIFIFIFPFAILAVSWDLLYGYTGQVNLGPVIPYGLAGFAAAYLSHLTNLPPVLILILAPAAGCAVSVVFIGIPSLRLKGSYLALVSF